MCIYIVKNYSILVKYFMITHTYPIVDMPKFENETSTTNTY
jgi:hypothetical protein